MKQDLAMKAFLNLTQNIVRTESGSALEEMQEDCFGKCLYVCFYIHPDGIDSRFGLSVGSLFAVIGNKYIIDSSLPESTSFTLVDTLHGVTLFFIFLIVTATAISLKLVKERKEKEARRFDMIVAQVVLLLYVIINIYFISHAAA